MEKIGEIDATATKRYLLTITKNATIDIYRKRNHQFQREIYVDELEECNVPVTYAETDVDDGILDILRRLPVNTGMYFSSNTPAIWTTMKSQKY